MLTKEDEQQDSSVILFRLFQMTSTHISDFRIVSTLDDPISSSYFFQLERWIFSIRANNCITHINVSVLLKNTFFLQMTE
jgi:hypothetical protein